MTSNRGRSIWQYDESTAGALYQVSDEIPAWDMLGDEVLLTFEAALKEENGVNGTIEVIVGQDKVTGWIDQLAKLEAILTQGNNIAGEIVGAIPPGVEEEADPTCAADSLGLRLSSVLGSAAVLVEQLDKIRARF